MIVETTPSLLEQFFYHSPDPMCVVSSGGKFTQVNNAFKSVIGFSDKELLGKSVYDFIHPEDHIITNSKIQSFLRNESDNYKFENRYISKDGEIKWFEWKGCFLSSEGYFCGIAHEVTENKIKTYESEDLRNKFLRVIDLVPHPIFLKDQDGKYVLVNQAQADLYSSTKLKMLGKVDSDFITEEEEIKAITESDLQVIRQKESVKLPVQYISLADGSQKILHTTKVPFLNTSDGEVNILGVSMDVTDLKQAEDELKRINFELDSFVYRSSHDLKAPLCSVLGLLNLVQVDRDQDFKEQCISEAQNSIRKLTRFITDLTDYSRNKRVNLKAQKINIYRLVDEVYRNLRYMDHADSIKLKVKIRQEFTFYSDEGRLRVILMNLLSNAIKYCDPSKSEMYIRVNVKKSGKNITLSIMDNGQGIETEFKDKIFEMFYRASESSFGSGLGLYIVKQVVQKLKGIISVHSRYKQGTIFTLVLPDMSEDN